MGPFANLPPEGELVVVVVAAFLLAALATGAPAFGVPLVGVIALGMGYSAYSQMGSSS